MPVITQTTLISADREVVFDLARSIDLHIESTSESGERAIDGCVTGLIGPNEFVTWEATHFGVRQHLTSKITGYHRPEFFRDTMVKGAFRRFDHDHHFEVNGSGTKMIDVFDYSSPFGMLGRLADITFLKRYLTNLLRERNEHIRSVAESGLAARFLK